MRTTVRPAALVAAYFDNLAPDERATAQALQRAVLEAAPGLEQTVKWGNLVFTWRGTNALAIVTHKTHANLQFFQGAGIAPQFPQLEGSGRGVRHLKCRYRQPVDEALVRAMVQAALDELA
ncbi:DUF1801 domain-containing protein [Caldimonas thermodepolymerans]|jgi:Uncharacterized conserved protein|uniref:DUF1801 domain-containing protein n=1 Tax=Caldimonas thermodepolymerans TaxID=215580 RepID=UPI002235E299|nr:DUF1801 domain-containing protein [Caldimonas thermodepolymerans]UZG43419.1 DUF1801 domain-containing protein [Caldimonas thermodepolymerans]